MRILLIAAFGVFGVLSRYLFGLWVSRLLVPPFPYGTFFINIVGAFVIGIIHVLGIERSAISVDLRLGMMVGFLGGFTTFSSYCLEATRLLEEAEYTLFAFYFVGSPVLGYLAALSGIFLTRTFFGWAAS